MNIKDYVHDQCLDALNGKYPEGSPGRDEAIARLAMEITALASVGRIPFMDTVSAVANFARSRGIGIGPGRGAVNSSLVAYLSGITSVDPLKHGLLFERFLHEVRRPRPVIAIDVEASRYGQVQEHLQARGNYAKAAIQFLPSTELDVLFTAVRSAWPQQDVYECLSRVPLDDAKVLAEIERVAAANEFTYLCQVSEYEAPDNFRVRSFHDVVAMECFYHFPDKLDLLTRFTALQRTNSVASGWPEHLASITSDTCGLIFYQEQALLLVSAIGGISLTETCDKLEVDRGDVANSTWTQLNPESPLACKAHLVGVALTAFWKTYLKVHYPQPADHDTWTSGSTESPQLH
jgi:DNA polymerase III alpha subunit